MLPPYPMSIKNEVSFSSLSVRRLAAIMFTDIVDYTALNQRDEAHALQVLESHNRLLRPFFQRYQGREVKTIGDSFLVEFDSALNAANCAIDIQQSLHEYNVSSRDEWQIKLRIGIHLGDVVHKENDIFGDAVNIASRIEPLADPGGICISGQVFDQIHNKTDYSMRQLGKTELKNVSFQTNIYSVVLPWVGKRGKPDEKDFEEDDLEHTRIAVLPFTNMSPNPEDIYFADGMTEEIITTLSGIGALSVISRTSVMGYKGTTKKLREIGKELEVGSVLQGSIRKAGNRIRISAQLIDVSSDKNLWVQNYDRQMDDVLAIQSEIASSITDQLKVKLIGTDKQRHDTRDIDAYTMYMKAMQLFYVSGEASLRQAMELLENAIANDPTFVRAIAGLSTAWFLIASHHYEDWEESLKKAELFARKAIELGPDCDEAHAALSQVFHSNDRFEEAVSEARKAIQINPNASDAHFLLGMNDFFILGRQDSGLKELEKGRELDPLSAGSASILAQAYDLTGRGTEALKLLLKLRDLDPKNMIIYEALASHYLMQRDFQSAKETVEAGMKIEQENIHSQISQGILFSMTGDKENAKRILSNLLNAKDESNRLNAALYIGAALGDLDQAFRALSRLAETHAWPFNVRVYPLFEDLRKDTRFKEFCSKVGIPGDLIERRTPFS